MTQTAPRPTVALPAAHSGGGASTGVGPGRRARVLHVMTHLDHGGAQDNTLLTVAGLDRDRYVVDLASGPGVLEAHARTVADDVHILGSLRRPLLDPGAGSTLFRLAQLCADYDIVHTHGSKAG